MNACYTLSNAFSASIDTTMWFSLFFRLVDVMDYIDFPMLNQPYIPWINPTWSWYVILLICCWIQCASTLLRIFASTFMADIGLEFSFLIPSLLVLVSGLMLASQNELGSILFPPILWNRLWRSGIISCLDVW